MTDETLPNDAVCRVEGENPTGRLDTGTVGALIERVDEPEGRVDVGHRGWNKAVGLTLAVEAEDAEMSTTIELSPASARELAAALNRRAAEVDIPPERDECAE